MITPLHATILGIVEGLTEYLPVSSTGHLILAASLLGLEGEAAKTFEVVIQAGAIVAVLALYWPRVRAMWRGLLSQDRAGLRLLVNLFISFLPAAIVGVALHHVIKERLFGVWPVVLALALGGVLMIVVDMWQRRHRTLTVRTIDELRPWEAGLIGLAQCLALWPGTSRSMITIVAGLLLGLPAPAAAEYSFLLALPTLGAATALDAVKGGKLLLAQTGWLSLALGFGIAALVAALAVRGLVRYLNRHGLAVFGWYRLALAALVLVVLHSS